MKPNISEIQKVYSYFFLALLLTFFAPSQTQLVAGSRCSKTAHLAGRASIIPGTAGSRNFQKACSLGDCWPNFQAQGAQLNSR